MNPAAIEPRNPISRLAADTVSLRPLVASLAFGLAFGLAGTSAYSASPSGESYLEALGASVPISDVSDISQTDNPLLAEAAPTNQLTHDGNIRHQSNVPVPGAAQPSQNQAQAQPQQANVAANAQSIPPRAVGNLSGGQPLPDPRIHPQSLVDIPQEVLNRLAPADTEQLRQVMRELYERQGAAITPPKNTFTTKASQYAVDLSPGAHPPVIRVATGVGATVNFVDAGGNPWPIAFANNFHSEAATITQMAPHVLSVAANSPHLTGSVGVMLQGLTTPVNFIVTPAQDSTDYRVDLLIPGMSPDAPPMVGGIQSRPDIAPGGLNDYLYGATPDGATRLDVSGVGSKDTTTRAWQDKNGNLVLRTSARVVSPGWYDMLPALDGTSVYQLPSSPVVRVSVNGKLQTFNIDGLMPKSSNVATR